MVFQHSFIRGDTRTLTITVDDTDGTPYAWAGSKLWFTAKTAYTDTDTDAVIAKTSDPGEGITFPADGQAKVVIDHADTADLPNERTVLFCDVQLLTADGDIYTIDVGQIIIGNEVTFAVA